MRSYSFLNYLLCYFFLMGVFSCDQTKGEVGNDLTTNIIWIIVEDLSPDFGFNGNPSIETPFVDSLHAIGKFYSGVFSTGVACSPSRTALATGYYQNSIGAYHMRYPENLKPNLPDSILPIHRRLMDAGYQTANITTFPGNGKTDWQFEYPEKRYDFNRWEYINPDKPFFARINLRLTHRPFENDSVNPIDSESIVLPPYVPDHKVSRDDWADYYESIQILDKQIAAVVKEIEKNGLTKNTVIFLFSDHGRPMTRAKNYLYDSGLNVPLIVFSFDNDIKEKYELEGEQDGLYSLIDVSKATLELGNVTGNLTQGISLLSDPGRDFVWAAADRIGEVFFKSRMIRNGRYKYIRNYNHNFSINEATTAYTKANYPTYHLYNILLEKGKLTPYQKKIVEKMEGEELYDLEKDPNELNNLLQDPVYFDTLDRMRSSLSEFTESIMDKGLERDSNEIEEAFEKYGTTSYNTNKEKIFRLKEHVYAIVQ